MLLLRGATPARKRLPRINRFNTCSSCEEQHRSSSKVCLELEFQYMLLLRGATYQKCHLKSRLFVSIHAPLARSNFKNQSTRPCPEFQYMLLLRGATRQVCLHRSHLCFNTCSSCEEQPLVNTTPSTTSGFNTCSSCEEQLTRLTLTAQL